MDEASAREIDRVHAVAERIKANVGRVIVGKDAAIELILVALLCEGHVLVEDVPGIGKTMLAKSVARTLGCIFRRIQFTPDLLPSDVTGLSFFNQKRQEFEFRPGPIFSQVVLADEINRATPRTQSALLEAMEERQVTLEGETRPLPRPFLVLATQNPIELEGTFPLPEAQLDRFLLRISLGYPDVGEEKAIVRRFRASSPLEELEPVVGADELLAMQRACREVHVAEPVEDYLVAIVRASRDHAALELGASPRATLALYRTAQALADLVLFAQRVAHRLVRVLGAERVCLVGEGTHVPHAHLKLYPLTDVRRRVAEGTAYHVSYEGYLDTLEGPRADDAALATLAARLRAG